MFGGEQQQRGVRRAHSPDGWENANNSGSFSNNSFRQGPPQWASRGGYQQPYFKRHRGDNYPQQFSLEDRIAHLGEVGSRNSDIGLLAKDLDADLMHRGQDEERIKILTARICRSIISFPTKISTYATLIGLISVKHYNVACQIINILHASYPVYLEAQRWKEALTIIHLLSSLVNCKVIRPSALLSQFEFLLESTLEDNIPQVRSDYFVYTVLSSLPFVANELASQPDTQENFEKIISTIESYLFKRSKDHLKVIRVWQSDDSTIQMDYLDSLWVQMKNFRATGWNEAFLHRPYNDKEYKDTMASSLIPTNSPTFQIPAHSDKYVYLPPKIVFRVYEDDVTEGQKSIPGSDKIERFCIENHIRNVIDEMSNDLKGCARHLTHMIRHDTLPMKHLLVETILGELFTLPRPPHDEILYYTLLYEFTRIFPPAKNQDEMKNTYDVVLNEAVKVLYDNLDTMNKTCFSRFIRWFTFHLNNTEFVYPWQTWQDAIGRDKTSPKSLFVQEILERCVRLTFQEKIKLLVEESLSDLMPPKASVQYQPIFAENPGANSLATTIKNLIMDKAEAPAICRALNLVIEGVQLPDDFILQDEKLSDQLLKIDIFTSVIIDLAASKSLTHLSSAIGKFRNVIKAMTKVPQGQVQLLQTMHSCLKEHLQLQVILVDKLLKAELVEPREVCNWLFSDLMKKNHVKSYPWEMLENTLHRLRRAVENLEAERDKPASTTDVPKPTSTNGKDGKAGDEGSKTPEQELDVEMMPLSQTEKEPELDEEQKKEAAKKEREALDNKIEAARETYKQTLIQVFRLFATVLTDHIQNCSKSNVSFIDDTSRSLAGRMQEVYYNHMGPISEFYEEVRGIVDQIPTFNSVIVNLNQ